MKTILQKAFALFLGVAIAVSLTACGGTEDVWSEWIDLVEVSDENTSSEEVETPSSEEQTTTEVSSPVSSRPVSAGSKTKATALHITVKEKSAYKIVASLSNEGYDEGRLLQKVIRATSKASVPMILDTEDKTGLEIVIGDTTREISQTLLSTLKENEYAYRADEEGNIAIVGSNATALTMGVEDFLKTYFGYDKNATAVGKESAVPLDLNVKKSVFSEYKLVWNDEFDGNQIDGTKWCFKPLMSAQPHLQLRSDESAVKVENGAVNLMSGRISSVDYYTNTALTTADTMVFKYGLLEMRAKVPFGRPAFPSFWLQSSAHGAQTPLVMGEIDIFEHFGTEDPYIQTGIHKWYRDGSGEHYVSKQIGRNFFDSKSQAEQWHTYSMWWTPSNLYFMVDGKIYHTIDISDETGDFGERGDGMQPFRDYCHIIFNNYLYTDNMNSAVAESEKQKWATPQDTFPIKYTIDYVRLYQLPGEGDLMNLSER